MKLKVILALATTALTVLAAEKDGFNPSLMARTSPAGLAQ